jgi:hypothetical protein
VIRTDPNLTVVVCAVPVQGVYSGEAGRLCEEGVHGNHERSKGC